MERDGASGTQAPLASDERLLSLVAEGDSGALGTLYDRFSPLAFSLALRVVRDPLHAEDVVQETFLAVWRSASSFEPARGTARTWILTLAHRRAVDLVRREDRRAASPLPEEELGAMAVDDPLLGLERERVRDALGRLPASQREALHLAYFGGYTQSEIAARLGQPLGTVKTRTFSALARLRTLLADDSRIPLVSPARARG